MEPLRVFSIIAVVLVIASSSNIFSSFRLNDNHVNSSIGSSSSLIDNIFFFLSNDGQSSFFSPLLQTTSAQEQEEQGEEQQGVGEEEQEEEEESGQDSDNTIEENEGQDEAESESDSSTEQDQQKDSQEESSQGELEEGEEESQEQEEIKADCGPEEHFDSAIDACIPDQEKVCDDQKDNDRDGKVDSEDLDCLPTKNEQLTQGEEARIADSNNEQENKTNESPTTLEQQDNNIFQNDSASSGSYGTVDGAQNNQNLTNSNSSAAVRDINNNNTLLNKSLSSSNASAAEGNLTLTCPPGGVTMIPGEQATLTCMLESKGDEPENLIIDCSGLQNSRIECYIDGQYLTKRTLINPMSHIDFSIVLISQSMPPTAAGTYSFDISVDKCINSDQC